MASLAGTGGARDLFAVEAMEPRILLSASPIDAPLSTTDVSVVPETQTAGDLMVQQSPATTSDIVLPVTLDTSHLYGETSDLPSTEDIDFSAPEMTSGDLKIDEASETSATSSPTTGTNDFVAHDEDKTTAPTEPVFDSMTTELVTTLRAANGPPADENSTTPVVNNFSNNSPSDLLLAGVDLIQAPASEGELLSSTSDNVFSEISTAGTSLPGSDSAPASVRAELPTRSG